MLTRVRGVIDAIATPVLLICALGMTGLVVKDRFFPSQAPLPEPTSTRPGRPVPLGTAIRKGTLFVGDPSAKVKIVEFADFQCPFCARSAEQLHALLAEHPGAFTVEFHHFPLSFHPYARSAALAAECAGEQKHFAEFYFTAYSNLRKVGSWSWGEFGKRAGVPDLAAFERCIVENRYGGLIDTDLAVTNALSLGGTPEWLVRDSLFAGLAPMTQVRGWAGLASSTSILGASIDKTGSRMP